MVTCNFRGGEWLRRRDGRGRGEVRVRAIHIARASLKKEGPANDGITPPKPNVEKNGNANPEVTLDLFYIHHIL